MLRHGQWFGARRRASRERPARDVEAGVADRFRLDEAPPVMEVPLAPLLKWAGGKERELRHITPLVPPFVRYFEPFVGGGAVFFALRPSWGYINDRSPELIALYRAVAQGDPACFAALDGLLDGWQRLSAFVDAHEAELRALYAALASGPPAGEDARARLADFVRAHEPEWDTLLPPAFAAQAPALRRELLRNLRNKTARMCALEERRGRLPERDVVANLESALKSAYYMHARHLLNRAGTLGLPPGMVAALFFFVRENAYASMFRYNRRGELNVPYGGISYNRKDLARKLAYLRSTALRRQLSRTVIENRDFADFLRRHAPTTDDFVFLDPPYDSEFSTYARNPFALEDQRRLADYLLHECPARFLLVIKQTPAIRALYGGAGLRIRTFDTTYLVSFQDRNERAAQHLIITNY
jgi:DNA adenine methylase